MPAARDVADFDARATGYEAGWLGRLHREIADRTARLALAADPAPRRLLDVGCGTGYLLRTLAGRCPDAEELVGIDPAPSMVEVATRSAADQRLRFSRGVAEQLPYPDATFDLIVSTTSFDHWSDQLAGLRECRRVLQPHGTLILVNQFSLWLTPTLVGSRRGKSRTKRRGTRLLRAAGFDRVAWSALHAVIINAVTAASGGGHTPILAVDPRPSRGDGRPAT